MFCIAPASNNCFEETFRQSFYDPDVDWEEQWFTRSLEHDLVEQSSRYKGMSGNYCSVCQIFCSEFDRVIDVVDSDLVIIRCQTCDLKPLSYCAQCRIRFPHRHCKDRGCRANPHHVGRNDLVMCERCNGCHDVLVAATLTFCQSCRKCHDESYKQCPARKDGDDVDTLIRKIANREANEKRKDNKNKNKTNAKAKNNTKRK